MSRFFRQLGDSDSDSEESDEELLISGDEDVPAQKQPVKPTGPAGMARFLRTAGSDSSSESDSSSDEDESDDDDGRAVRGARSDDEESEDEDVKHIVKSTKDKRLDEIEATGKAMENALKINDWTTIPSGKCHS